MYRSIALRTLLPAIAWYGLLFGATLLADLLLHQLGLKALGLWLGPLGVLLLVVSFAYSLRKRRWIAWGSPKSLLTLHETLGWVGALLICVHSGIHLHALLPWAATVLLLVVVASGFIGSVLLKRALAALKARESGGPASVELFDAVAVDAMKQWRRVHMPLNAVFVGVVVAHLLGVLVLRGW